MKKVNIRHLRVAAESFGIPKTQTFRTQECLGYGSARVLSTFFYNNDSHRTKSNPRMMSIPPIVAHRGASGDVPENTLLAFRTAEALGARCVEFDVRLTRDRKLIVFHDDMLNRLTSDSGLVEDHTFEELSTLTVRGEHIPLFEEVIACLGDINIGANIELKASPALEKETAEKAITLLQKHWPAHLPPPLISSFQIGCLKAVRYFSNSVSLGLLLADWSVNWRSVASKLNCVSVHVDKAMIDDGSAGEIKYCGYRLGVYTVNNPDRAAELFSLGADFVFTDYPGKLLDAMSITNPSENSGFHSDADSEPSPMSNIESKL